MSNLDKERNDFSDDSALSNEVSDQSDDRTSDLTAEKNDSFDSRGSQKKSLKEEFSQVATSGSSKKIIIGALALLIVYTLYETFSSVKKSSEPVLSPTAKIQERSQSQTSNKIIKDAKPFAESNTDKQPELPKETKAPEAPPIQAPKLPEPPPAAVPSAPQAPVFPSLNNNSSSQVPTPPQVFQPGIPTASDILTKKGNDEEREKALKARRKASIMVMGSGAGASAVDDNSVDSKDGQDKKTDKADASKSKDQQKPKDKSEFLGFGEGAFGGSNIPKTTFAQVKVSQIGKLESIIAQGKVINAVLETAINTDLEGNIRAIVSRDVYAESGASVLIPKGSRVIGSYKSDAKPGMTRVAVVWSRLIRPDGIDIALDASATDKLGRSGVSGFLDNKFLTRLSNAFLISYILPLAVMKISKTGNEPITETTSTGAGTGTGLVTTTTSTTSTKAKLVQEGADKLKEVMSKAIEESFSTKPTIYVDQGTEITLIVNKDIVFPDQLSGQVVLK